MIIFFFIFYIFSGCTKHYALDKKVNYTLNTNKRKLIEENFYYVKKYLSRSNFIPQKDYIDNNRDTLTVYKNQKQITVKKENYLGQDKWKKNIYTTNKIKDIQFLTTKNLYILCCNMINNKILFIYLNKMNGLIENTFNYNNSYGIKIFSSMIFNKNKFIFGSINDDITNMSHPMYLSLDPYKNFVITYWHFIVNQFITSAIPQKNNNIVISGKKNNYNSTTNIFVSKINTNGVMYWFKEYYHKTQNLEVVKIFNDTNNLNLIFGNIYSDNGSECNGYIMTTDYKGNLNKFYKINTEDINKNKIYDVVNIDNNSYAVFGQNTLYYGINKNLVYIVKNYSTIWSKEFENNQINFTSISNIKDNYISILGYKKNEIIRMYIPLKNIDTCFTKINKVTISEQQREIYQVNKNTSLATYIFYNQNEVSLFSEDGNNFNASFLCRKNIPIISGNIYNQSNSEKPSYNKNKNIIFDSEYLILGVIIGSIIFCLLSSCIILLFYKIKKKKYAQLTLGEFLKIYESNKKKEMYDSELR